MDDEAPASPKLPGAKLPAVQLPGPKLPPEVDGPKGPEPTRYGDWEQKGRCTDF